VDEGKTRDSLSVQSAYKPVTTGSSIIYTYRLTTSRYIPIYNRLNLGEKASPTRLEWCPLPLEAVFRFICRAK